MKDTYTHTIIQWSKKNKNLPSSILNDARSLKPKSTLVQEPQQACTKTRHRERLEIQNRMYCVWAVACRTINVKGSYNTSASIRQSMSLAKSKMQRSFVTQAARWQHILLGYIIALQTTAAVTQSRSGFHECSWHFSRFEQIGYLYGRDTDIKVRTPQCRSVTEIRITGKTVIS